MGLDTNIYALDKRYRQPYMTYNALGEDYFDKCCVCSWRKWFSLTEMMIRRLSASNPPADNKYDYIWRMKKKDLKFFESQVKDLKSEVYWNTVWYTVSKKDKKKWRDLFLKDIKSMRKELKKGKSLYLEASY